MNEANAPVNQTDDSIDRQLADRLRACRPSPTRRFGADLRERLAALELDARRPARLWALVAVYLAAGVLLLLLAALGASGSGPFG